MDFIKGSRKRESFLKQVLRSTAKKNSMKKMRTLKIQTFAHFLPFERQDLRADPPLPPLSHRDKIWANVFLHRSLGDACKIKIAHILSLWDKGWGGGRQKSNCLKHVQKWAIFYCFPGKKSLIFWGIWDKRWGGGRQFSVVSKRQNMSDFYFASTPYH